MGVPGSFGRLALAAAAVMPAIVQAQADHASAATNPVSHISLSPAGVAVAPPPLADQPSNPTAFASPTSVPPILAPETITGQVVLAGPRVVAPGVALTVRDADVTFVTSGAVQLEGIFVEPGGSVTIHNSTVSNEAVAGESASQRAGRPWHLVAAGTVNVDHSRLMDLEQVLVTGAPASIVDSSISEARNCAIAIVNDSKPVMIRGNTITHNYGLGSSDPEMTPEFSGAIYLGNTTGVVVAGNVIQDYNGTGGIVSQASTHGSSEYADNALIAGNILFFGQRQDRDGLTVAVYLDGGAPSVENNGLASSEGGIATAYDTGAQIQGNSFIGQRIVAGDQSVLGDIAFNNVDPGRAYHRVPTFTSDYVASVADGMQNLNDGKATYRVNEFVGSSYGAIALDSNDRIDPRPAGQINMSMTSWTHWRFGPDDRSAADGSQPLTNNGQGARVVGNINYTNWYPGQRRINAVQVQAAGYTTHTGAWRWTLVWVRNLSNSEFSGTAFVLGAAQSPVPFTAVRGHTAQPAPFGGPNTVDPPIAAVMGTIGGIPVATVGNYQSPMFF